MRKTIHYFTKTKKSTTTREGPQVFQPASYGIEDRVGKVINDDIISRTQSLSLEPSRIQSKLPSKVPSRIPTPLKESEDHQSGLLKRTRSEELEASNEFISKKFETSDE